MWSNVQLALHGARLYMQEGDVVMAKALTACAEQNLSQLRLSETQTDVVSILLNPLS